MSQNLISNDQIFASAQIARQAASKLTGIKMELVKIICAVFLPPLGAFLQVGIGKHFWINIVLTLFGYIPGVIHAVWVVAKNK